MVELEQLERIDKYLQVLIEVYPTPLNQTQIAEKASVSKAAVSQIRDNLYKICEVQTMIYKKKLVLKADNETRFNLFLYFFYAHDALTLQQILSYEYFNIVKFSDLIYEYILDQNKEYDIRNFFTKDEFRWIVHFLKDKILHYQILLPENGLKNDYSYELTMDQLNEYLPFGFFLSNWMFLKDALLEKDISFLNTKDDFIMMLTLRDKIYSFIINNITFFDPIYDQIIEYLEVQNINEMEEIHGAYDIVLKLLVKKILNSFTEIASNEIQRKGLEIKNMTLGSYFTI